MHVLTIPMGDRGYTDGRVKCRKPVEEPGTAPRVRVGNFVALLIERKSSVLSCLLRFLRTQLGNESIRVIKWTACMVFPHYMRKRIGLSVWMFQAMGAKASVAFFLFFRRSMTTKERKT